MKISAVEIKPGMIIEHNNDYWNVLKAQHVKPGKGGAFNQVELKSITKGTKLNERFRSSETVEKAELEEKKFNFLYLDEENCHFMDNKTFEQISIPKDLTDEKYKLLTIFSKKIAPCSAAVQAPRVRTRGYTSLSTVLGSPTTVRS